MKPLATRVGRALWDEHLLFGKNLHRDVVPRGLIQLLPLFVSGKMLDPADAEIFSRFAVCTCITDPHVWPLKVARLGAAYGRIVPGVAIGALLQESDRVGGLPTVESARWLVRLRAAAEHEGFDRAAEQVLGTMPAVIGFGVPFRDQDERVMAIRNVVADLGAEGRPYWALWERAATWMKEHRRVSPNVCSAAAAIMLDMGMAPEDTGPIFFWLILLTQFANAVEGARQAPRTLRALPDEAVRYEGHASRSSSRVTS